MTFEQFGKRLEQLEGRVQDIEDRLPETTGAKRSAGSGADAGDAKKEPKRER